MSDLFFKRPLDSIKIENTNICNANCIFCSYSHMTRPKETMSLDLFALCVDQVAEIGIPNISFSPINGEPLVDPSFFKKLKYLNQYNFGVTSITNGILLNSCSDTQIDMLLSSLKQLRISIAPNSTAHRFMYRVNKFDEVVRGLSRLHRLSHARDCDVVICIRLNSKNSSLSPQLDALLKEVSFTVVRQEYEYKNWGGIIQSLPDSLPFDGHASATEIKKPCVLAARPAILSNGSVCCCTCADYDGKITFGDIRHEHLSEIIYSKKRRNFIRSFQQGAAPKPCKACSFYAPPPQG